MGTTRIELLERYSTKTQDEIESLKNIYQDKWQEQVTYKYRRTNPRISDIERIVEIPDNEDECRIRFYGGYSIVVKGNFDDLCIDLNDMEHDMFDMPEEY